MSLFRRTAGIAEDARRDALAGVNSVEEHIRRRLGLRPEANVAGNHEHGRMAHALQRGREVEELNDDRRRVEDEAAHHPHPLGLALGIVFCFAVEILGGILVMRAVGVGEGERLPLGVALGLALIGITAVTSSRAAPGAGRRSATVLVLGVYSVLVISLAVVRLRSSDEEGGGLSALPETIVMIATTVGPAWLAEHFLRKRRPAVAAHAGVSRIKRRIRAADRERSRGDAFLTDIARRRAAYDDEAARLRATYETEYRLAQAERGRLLPENPNQRS